MGQKAHPYGLRVGYIKPWKSKWFAKRDYIKFLHEDLKLRKFLHQQLAFAGISNIEIERSVGKVRVKIHAARPGVIIGRRGQEIDRLRDALADLTENEVLLDIKEVKTPQIDAQLVAETVALQLEKRVAFRKAMKRAITQALAKGAQGIKIRCAGRLGGSEIARKEGYKEGKIPLNTFRADIDYGFTEARTTYGSIGVKVWLYKGEVLKQGEPQEVTESKATPKTHAQKKKAAPVEAVIEVAQVEDKPDPIVPDDKVDDDATDA